MRGIGTRAGALLLGLFAAACGGGAEEGGTTAPTGLDAAPRRPVPADVAVATADAAPAAEEPGAVDGAGGQEIADARAGEAPVADTARGDGPPPGSPGPTGPAVEPEESASPVLPLILVDVGGKTIPSGSKIPCTVKVVEDHDGTHRNVAARPAALESACGFGARGATSLQHPKKAFGLELRDAAGADRALALAGMPPESDWVLHSCYADKSCLRNVLAYSLGRALGRWAPRTRFVELFVDGKLHGLYVAIEKIKRDRNRVALPRAAMDATGDLSGGYIVKAEAGGEGMPGESPARDWVSPVEPRVWSFHEPRHDEVTAAQRQYLRDHLTKFETLARGARFTDSEGGYAAWIDVASWVDFALMQEITANVDAYFKSVYVTKQPDAAGGKLVAGPIWDFDLAFGNVTFREGNRHDIWAHGANRFMPWSKSPYTPPGFVSRVPTYWEKLWADRGFQGRVKCRWQELRKGAFATAAIHARIDGWGKKLGPAQARDQAIWKSLSQDVNANAFLPASYAAELKYLKDWVDRRLRWIDANLPGACPTGA